MRKFFGITLALSLLLLVGCDETTSEVSSYTVEYVDYDGTVLQTEDYEFGADLSEVTAPDVPSREGYVFEGWYGDEVYTTMPSEDVILYAIWNPIIYEIKYYLDEGSNEDNPTTYNVETSTLLLNKAKREGYSFIGWFDNPEFTGKAYTEIPQGTTGHISLYGKWEINQYIITYALITDNFNPSSDILLNAGEFIIQVSLGDSHSSILTSEGRVFAWGENSLGQLGDGTTIDRYIPVEVTNNFSLNVGEKILCISTGSNHAAALTSYGRILTWGFNYYGQLGNGVTSVNDANPDPIDITNHFNLKIGETIVHLGLGSNNSSALTSEGRIFSWGLNHYGQIGDGTTLSKYTPVEITNNFNLNVGESIVNIALGSDNSLALTSEGRVFAWGINNFGQLGDGRITEYNPNSSPIEITSNFDLNSEETIVSIASKWYHCSALTSEGRVFTWGYNETGQLGDGTTINRDIPVNITNQFSLNSEEEITSISLQGYNTSVLTSKGRVFTWGSNYYGQLGDGTRTNNYSPVDVTTQFDLNVDETINSIYLGYGYALAMTTENRLLTWGKNDCGQLGDGTIENKYMPVSLVFYAPEILRKEVYYFNAIVNEYLPILEGYTFNGWYSDVEGTIPYIFGSMPAGNLTLYGKWTN